MKLKFNLKKHLEKNKLFGIGIGFHPIPSNIASLLSQEGTIRKETLVELNSELYLLSFKIIDIQLKHREDIEKNKGLKGTKLFTDLIIMEKDKEFKLKILSKAIRKIERFYI